MTRRSWITLSLLILVAGGLRFMDLGVPDFMIFDEGYYASDACRYVNEGRLLCGIGEFTFAHPPVAKWLIASGIWAFGPTAIGARLTVALFGTLSVGVLFLLAKKLLRSEAAAAIAAGLLAIDSLHLVTSRVAILEVFASFFVLVALLSFVNALHSRSESVSPPEPDPEQTRHWLFRDINWSRLRFGWRWLAGAAMGLAIGSKWTMAPVLLGLIVVAVAEARRRNASFDRPLLSGLRSEGRSILLTLVLVPFLVYAVSFIGRIEGSFLVLPWEPESWYRAFATRHMDMIDYHLDLRRSLVGLRAPAYESAPWSWPVLQRPIPYSFVIRGETYREILSLGNPLVWWPGLLAIAYIVLARRGAHVKRRLRSMLGVGIVGTYLYWLLPLPGLNNVFVYYFVAAVPFLCLAVGAIADELIIRKGGRFALAAYLAMVLAVFAFFYPVLTWKPLSYEAWNRRMLFSDCVQKDLDGKPVIAGFEFGLGMGTVVEAYPPALADEREPFPLLTRGGGGWCWY